MDAWLDRDLLFLHVVGAIVAFGPAFSVPDRGPDGRRKEPQHANFAARRLNARRSSGSGRCRSRASRMITGLGMNTWTAVQRAWLGLAIVLYLIASRIRYSPSRRPSSGSSS